jgi:cytochrome oxidase assembly protein ShyY1
MIPPYCRGVFKLLVRPRFLAVWLVVAVVAGVCVVAGIWQWQRLHEKHAANVELRENSRSAPVDVRDVLPDSSASTASDAASDARYRQVLATGVYDTANQVVVRGQTVGSSEEGAGEVGFLVLTPLRLTADAQSPAEQGEVLLVVRGFVRATRDATTTPAVPAPPAGEVTIEGRVRPAESADDKYGQLPDGQVDSINSAGARERLGGTVLAGYVELEQDQPGGEDLIAIPAPSLSNPAGGAIEPQHLAYVVQWFIFALLALALPFILARADMRADAAKDARERARRRSAPADPGADGTGAEETGPAAARAAAELDADQRRAAKLAERYGR